MPSLSIFTCMLATIAAISALSAHQCSTNTQVAGEFLNGSVVMNNDPAVNFDSPMTSGFNLTNGEDWSFEGVSADGQSGMAVMFSRGTIASNLLAQRMFIGLVWPNGTRFMETSFANTSTIQTCRDVVKGRWLDTTAGMDWTFESSIDSSHTVVNIESATVQGTFTLNAISPAVYPNGLIYPNPQGDYWFAPYLYWAENVPVGIAEANLTVRGTPFTLNGIGGRERNWNSFAWAEVSTSWDMFRAEIGPYTVMTWSFLSKIDGQTYFSSVLMKGKKVIFRTQTQQESANGTYGSLDLRYNGTVHLTSDPSSSKPLPESRHTGYVLELEAPVTRERWRFEVDYTRCVYWFPAGITGKVGGFVGAVKGGPVGGPQYIGRASGNVMEKN